MQNFGTLRQPLLGEQVWYWFSLVVQSGYMAVQSGYMAVQSGYMVVQSGYKVGSVWLYVEEAGARTPLGTKITPK